MNEIFQAVQVYEHEHGDETPWNVDLVIDGKVYSLEMHEDKESAEELAAELRVSLHKLILDCVEDVLEHIVQVSVQDMRSDLGFVALGNIERAARHKLEKLRKYAGR